jgi:hypothetical protein
VFVILAHFNIIVNIDALFVLFLVRVAQEQQQLVQVALLKELSMVEFVVALLANMMML